MKKIISVILVLALALSLTAVPVFAGEKSMDNFTKTNIYNGQFTDTAGHWAAGVIQTCYEYGLMNGKSAATFVPAGNLTVAEALVMASRVHEIYTTGASTLTNGTPWYQPYVDYATANGIIAAGEFTDFNAKILRSEMAHIFAKALPEGELSPLNIVTTLPDVPREHKYADSIYLLYKAGILTGSDVYGTFKPESNITRAEAAAIIARVAIPAERKITDFMKQFQLNEDLSVGMPVLTARTDNSDGSITLESDLSIMAFTETPGGGDLLTSVTQLTLDQWSSVLSQAFEQLGMPLGNSDVFYMDFGGTTAVCQAAVGNDGTTPVCYTMYVCYFDTEKQTMVSLMYLNDLSYSDLTLLDKQLSTIKIKGKSGFRI